MRTREQILADCEKRYAEMCAQKERIENDPNNRYSCRTCRWASSKVDICNDEVWHCNQPLATGFDGPVLSGHWSGPRINLPYHHEDHPDPTHGRKTKWKFPMPCGPEKGLWEPKLTLWERIVAIFS